MENKREIIKTKQSIDTTITFTNHNNIEINMDIVAFGKGSNVLVLIPGLSDGFSSVKGKLLLLKWSYRIFAKDFRVLAISRPINMPEKYSIEDMADDYYNLLKYLNCNKVNIWGVSMGGMIAQWICIKNPDFISSVCLDVTTGKTSNTTKDVLINWIKYANNKNHKELILDTIRRTYTDKYLRAPRKTMFLQTLFLKKQEKHCKIKELR